MKRLEWSILIAVLAILVVCVPVLAVVTNIKTIVVTESSGNTYVNYPFIHTQNNASLVTLGQITASGLDTRILQSGTAVPHMLATDRTLFVGSAAPNAATSYQYTAGNPAATALPIIVGNGGYVTTADNATLEPSDNFSLTLSGYFPMSGSGDIFKKLDALRLSYSGTTLTLKAGNNTTPDITLTATGVTAGTHLIKVAVTFSGGTGASVYLYPTGVGDVTQLGALPGGTPNWQAAASANHGYKVTNGGYLSNLYDLYTVSSLSVSGFDAVKTHFDLWHNDISDKYGSSVKMPGSPVVHGTQYANASLSSWVSLVGQTWATNPITGLQWNPADLVNIQFGIQINKLGSLGNIDIDNFYIELTNAHFYPVLNLYVDDMVTPVESADMSVPIPDNSNNWVWYPNPYFDYIKLSTGN